ncbi:MAG: tyrosine-type recombinase/integrase, partial [Thermodesulfobacteriota bacterium]
MTKSIPDIIETFLAQKEAERRLSANSLRGYRKDLTEFLSYLTQQGAARVDQIDPLLLRGFLAQLHKKNKKSTVGRKIAALRSCFRYALNEGWITENPLSQVRTPKKDKTIPPFLSEKEVEVLLKEPDNDAWLELRDQAFLEVFYASGLRLSELAALDWKALDLSLGLLRVVGKGGKERIVPMGRKAIEALGNYRKAVQEAEQRSEIKLSDR